MRVICIDDTPRHGLGLPRVKQGKEYTQLGWCRQSGRIIQGVHPYINEFGRLVISCLPERMIELSEIDERELSHAEPIESTLTLIER